MLKRRYFMLRNSQGFTLIESMFALILMSAMLSIFLIQIHQDNMYEKVVFHQTNAYHILDNVLMEILYLQDELDESIILRYNTKFEKDQHGIYQVIIDEEARWIKVYLIETMKEVLHYEYQR